jgi:hypothetical protein
MDGQIKEVSAAASKIESQVQQFAYNLDFLAENVHRLHKVNAKLVGEKVEKTNGDNVPMREPDGIVNALQVLNEKFEAINSAMSTEVNELNEII